MAGDSTKVEMGVCGVSFGGEDLGYTKGGVKVSYSTDSVEITVDQEDVPVSEIITKQTFEVKVPLAEYDIQRFADLLPGATYVVDGTTPTKVKLVLSGAAGGDLLGMSQALILSPAGGTENDKITMHHAIPVPSLEFAYEKDNQRVFEVTFKAMKGVNGFVTFGDVTAAA